MPPNHFNFGKYLESCEYEGERIYRLNEHLVATDYDPSTAQLILDTLFSFLQLHHRYNYESDQEVEPPPDEKEKATLVIEMQKLWPTFDRYGVNPYAFIDLERNP